MSIIPPAQNNLFSHCGQYCLICMVHKMKKKPCENCNGNGCSGAINRVQSCPIRICSEVKNHLHCSDCEKFPCKKMLSLEDSYA